MKILENTIKVDFDPKTKKLACKVPFFLADVARGFPSRKFDAKTKLWMLPLTKSNIDHLKQVSPHLQLSVTEEARNAIRKSEEITAAPVAVPFPYHLYDFRRSKSGFDPMGHQRRMLDRAWNFHAAAWFAKMGTGKTFATIHLACARFAAGLIDAVVIICPSTLRATWR
ncbi:MAG: hypothetical protein ACRC8N_15765, partial [Aeromonas veronii]